MPVINFIENESGGIFQNADYPRRPRLNKLFKDAVNFPLIVVCAGIGYGKTQAVHSFVKDHDAYTSWHRMSSDDNTEACFWEGYSKQASLLWPKTAERLKKTGFPQTEEAFCEYSAIISETSLLTRKYIMVFDDFHLLRSAEILRFLERGINKASPDLTMIFISRAMPEINLIRMIKRDKVFMIQEDALCFTEDEIADYYNQIKIPLMSADIRNIYDDTKGWAFAVNLIARSLEKERKYERYALSAVKKNMLRYIEAEIPKTISQRLMHLLLRISLIDHLTASLVKALAPEIVRDNEFISQMETLNAFIRYDFIMDTYIIHPLFREHMRQIQEQMLTDEERRETYFTAGEWCGANGYNTDALFYYEKSAGYDAIINKIASFNVQIPKNAAGYALEIFDRMPDSIKADNPLFPSMYLKLKINMDQFEDAHIIAEQYIKKYEAQAETPERNQALTAIYTFWGLLRMKMCAYTDVYDFKKYFMRLSEYYENNPFKFIGSYKTISAGAWATNVGTTRPGAMEEYIAAVSRMTSYFSDLLTVFFSGLEDLLRGELYFYQRNFNDAEQYLKQSIAKARKQDQYITQNMAIVYLMHIDFSKGDFAGATAKFKEIEAQARLMELTSLNTEEPSEEKDYSVRYTIYDIASGFYYLSLDQAEEIPEWLKGIFSPFTHMSFPGNYANRIIARYHYNTNQYNALLEYIDNTIKHPLILFGKIELKVLQALSFYKLKKRKEAINAFTEAYYLSESNKIIASFTEFAKDMRTLTLAAHKEKTCPIPKKWLEDVNRISSIYAKRKIKMISEYEQAVRTAADKSAI